MTTKTKPNMGVAAFLAAFPVLGVLGIDKFYAGATNVGIVQLVLSLTLFGLIFTGPWSWLSAIVLVVAVFSGSKYPMFYPNVKWDKSDPLSEKTWAGFACVLLILSLISGITTTTTTTEKFKTVLKKRKDKQKQKKPL